MPEQHPPMTGLESRFDEEIEAASHGTESHKAPQDPTMRDKREASVKETEADKRTEEVMILGQ